MSNSKFVVHKHKATNLHFDFRMEIANTLKSWAIPKGPSMNSKERRLAIAVEDHDLDYGEFEGIITEGYGKGSVLLWDRGTYKAMGEEKIEAQYKKGHLKFILSGQKLKGGFALIRTKMGGNDKNWLLIKEKDEHVSGNDILREDKSVKSGKKIEDLKDE